MQKQVTIQDIATKVGVSKTTVSFALNDRYKPGVNLSGELRDRIKEAARQLGYMRNGVARQMATGSTNVIAYFSSDLGAAEFSGKILSSIMMEAAKEDYFVKLFFFDKDDVEASVRRMIEQRPAGVVCRAVRGKAYHHLRRITDAYGIPVASTDLIVDTPNGIFAPSDDFHGMRLVVGHLVGLGHQRLAYVGLRRDEDLEIRCSAFVEAVKESGSGLIETTLERLENGSPNCVCESYHRMKESFAPTALVCATDYLALGMLRVAHEDGLSIPEDLSVTGFSNMALTEHSHPPLTTVKHSRNNGGVATRLLLDALKNNSDVSKQIILEKTPTELVVRKSSGPPPPPHPANGEHSKNNSRPQSNSQSKERNG